MGFLFSGMHCITYQKEMIAWNISNIDACIAGFVLANLENYVEFYALYVWTCTHTFFVHEKWSIQVC